MQRLCLPFLALLLFATPAMTIELRNSVRTQTGYDSNALRGGKGDMVVEVFPRLELRDPDGRLTYDVNYTPTYRYFVTTGTDGGWSHVLGGNATWTATPKLSFTVTERFARLKNVDLEDTFTSTDPSINVPDTELASDRSKSNQASVAVNWAPSVRDVVTLSGRHTWRSFDEVNRGDLQLFNATLGYRRQIDTPHNVGVDFSFSRNLVENPLRDRTDGTDFYNASLTWAYQWDQNLAFFVSGGPTLVVRDDPDPPLASATVRTFPIRAGDMAAINFLDAGSCPRVNGFTVNGPECGTNPQVLNSAELATYVGQGGVPISSQIDRDPRDSFDDETTSLTYFANVSVRKTWGRVDAELGYVRRASTSPSDVGSSTVADAVRLTTTWNASSRLRVALLTSWVRRTQDNTTRIDRISVTPVNLDRCILVAGLCSPLLGQFSGVAMNQSLVSQTIDAELIQDQFLLQLSGRYRLRRNFYLTGSGNYRYITDDSDIAGERNDDRWRVLFGVEYRFDPLVL